MDVASLRSGGEVVRTDGAQWKCQENCVNAGSHFSYLARSGKRSPQRIAKWFRACGQPCMVCHFLATFISAKYSSLIAASSLGKEPRVLISLRRVMFRDSTALVV